MEEIARVYAEALFEVAKEKGKLDVIRDQLGRFADALEQNRELAVFFFSPYFSSAEKRDGIERAVVDAESELTNFLELLVEKHRMPVIFRMRRQFDEMWAEENKLLEVTLTSAVELDPEIVRAGWGGNREADRPKGGVAKPRRRSAGRRAGAPGRQHGARREHPQQARET